MCWKTPFPHFLHPCGHEFRHLIFLNFQTEKKYDLKLCWDAGKPMYVFAHANKIRHGASVLFENIQDFSVMRSFMIHIYYIA
jgi:hypothetical protein